MEIEVSSLLKKAQFLFWTVLFVFLIYATINFQGTKDPSLIMSLYQVIGIVIHASLFFIIMTLFFYIKNITNKKKRREIRNFGILYFICLVITDFVGPRFSSLLGLYHLPVQFLTAPLLQIPPLFYLKRYLQKYYVKSSLMEDRSDELSLLFEKKKISSREREVLQLILEGKSNAEIEKALFISPHTVRNHIYNIYQKLGVQNRIQVVNLMHATLRKDNGKIQNSLV